MTDIINDENMSTLTLKEIQNRIRQNSYRSQRAMEQITLGIYNKNLRKGRVRPKNPTEAKILDGFSRR
ncbi:hypothetical protein F3157_05180 [Virgibacillus dakarensis]|uniref:Uncharacterized protein n=1 Tax=Lentibacillus populi TaxID=1827502 RepID=A0A9W5X4C3_9BACI|nr:MULTISPECIES: hypothetical protein [Bacillaceae]MBT2214371.1 hypothetical protein [Virgibacillus dakarensis]MTW85050.1 hypothetical protein [Virgibacillus dakarensis]GGB34338.1 hypothetical protein GCM10011409_09750 [Lentibacillus populi]